MTNQDRLKRLRLFEEKMAAEQEFGYPLFKLEIANSLENKYGLDKEEAKQYAFDEEVNRWIMNDIDWAQHMGSEYWADVIQKNLFHHSKRLMAL